MNAHSSEYIINLLGQRTEILEEPARLHLTRPGNQLEIKLPPANLSVYENPAPESKKATGKTNQPKTNTHSDE